MMSRRSSWSCYVADQFDLVCCRFNLGAITQVKFTNLYMRHGLRGNIAQHLLETQLVPCKMQGISCCRLFPCPHGAQVFRVVQCQQSVVNLRNVSYHTIRTSSPPPDHAKQLQWSKYILNESAGATNERIEGSKINFGIHRKDFFFGLLP